MIKWFKKNSSKSTEAAPASSEAPIESQAEFEQEAIQSPQHAEQERVVRSSLYDRFKQSLSKTRKQLGGGIGRLLLGKKTIDAALFDDIETHLIQADIGIPTVQRLMSDVSDALNRKDLSDGEMILAFIKKELEMLLLPLSVPFSPVAVANHQPYVILVVGVNGAGKTTTIGKLAKHLKDQGKKVMLAAGDTFRAAATEQLQSWGKRHDIPVIAQQIGSDSASVIFDAVQSAKARGIDVLIADTAGRLHTQNNLMEELKKVKRVIQKIDPQAPQEIMLVLDASIGQNALNQAREFHHAVSLTGITMTKLDGTAKGGILFAIARELGIPFRYLGIGEGVDDLRPFDASQFVEAIFHDDTI